MYGCGRGNRGGRGRGRRQWASDDGWEEWGGYMSAKKQKLEDQSTSSSVISSIFTNVSVFVNGYTDPACHEIKRLVTSNGGSYQHYYSRTKVTHIIASNLPTSKINQIRDEKVVKPSWIVDSVNFGKLMPYQRYLLYKSESCNQNVFFNSKNPVTSDAFVGAAPTEQCVFNSGSAEVGLNFETQLPANTSTVPCVGIASTLTNLSSSVVSIDEQSDLSNNSEDLLFETETLLEGNNNIDIDNSSSGVFNTEHSRNLSKPLDIGTASEIASPVNSMDTEAENRKRVTEFFSHSRLHYISTWCAESKAYVASLQNQEKLCLPGREKLRQLQAAIKGDEILPHSTNDSGLPKLRRIVMHVDMDCFFVSVGLRSRPDLRGKPVAVTHSKGRGPASQSETQAIEMEEALWSKKGMMHSDKGSSKNSSTPGALITKDVCNSMAEIASCSYEARQAGVKNGMLFGRAKQLCPDLIPIPYDFEEYQSVSRLLYDTVASYTHDIEAVSCDEMFVDCLDLINDTGASCLNFATLLREDIFKVTGCTASVGIGANMLQAKMATREAKPNGQYWLIAENVNGFFRDKKVGDLHGVGYSLKAKLDTLGISTCGDLQKQTLQYLQKNFGIKTGQSLYDHCRGIDDRLFQTEAARKSVSAEMNYGIRFTEMSQVENFLGELASEVHSRMTKIQRKCKCITLKLKVRQPDAPMQTAKFMGHGICDNISKSSKLALATSSVDVITAQCLNLLRKIALIPSDLRGVGIQLSGLEPLQPGVHSSTSGLTSTGFRSILDFTTSMPSIKDSTANLPVGSVSHVDSVASYATKSLPPLPSLDLNSTLSETDQRMSSRSSSDCSWYLPASSQIDMEVLQALPSDIRNSIERALCLNGNSEFSSVKQIKIEQADRHGSADSERPSCSFWSDVQPTSRYEPTLPSFSQLDADVMDALPDDIRREIHAAYQTDGNTTHVTLETTEALPLLHPLMRPEIINSPTQRQTSPKQTSPSKLISTRTSPKKITGSPFKAPIGQPPRRKKYTARKKVVFAVKQKQVAGPSLSMGDALKTASNSSVVDHGGYLERGVDASANVAFVVGSESLSDIKSMLREWLKAYEGPSKEDLEAFVSYLVQLVHSCNLEKVCIVLKFMQRLMRREAAPITWQNGVKWIVDQTQTVVRSVYGGPLQLTTN